MTERNTFVDVVDGNQLNQGYFNGIGNTFSYALTQDIIQNLNLRKITLTSGRVRTTEDSFIYDLCLDRSVIDTDNTNASLIDVNNADTSKQSFWGAMTVYDDNNDDTFSTTNWGNTTGMGTITQSEAGGGAGNNETSYALVSLAAGNSDDITVWAKNKDFKANAKDATIYIKFKFDATLSGQYHKLKIVNTNAASAVNLAATGITDNTDYIFRIEINYAAQTATVYKNETLLASNINISSLAQWYVALNCSGLNEQVKDTYIYYMRYIDTVTTQYVYRDMTTASATVTKAILYTNDDLTYGSMARTISADNGSNYESATNKDLTQFTNTGTQIIPKIAITSTATQTAKLKEYGIIYLGAC